MPGIFKHSNRTSEARPLVAAPAYASAASGGAAHSAAYATASDAIPSVALPATSTVRSALNQQRYRQRFGQSLRSTVFILVVVAAAAVLVAVLLLPVLRIFGTSMHGTLDADDVVLSIKTNDLNTGDVVAFYYNNILVKRAIANSGQWVDIDSDGNVYVDGNKLDEPYLSSKAYGDNTNVEFPYQVPDGKVFVMGDNREVSIDSRNTAVGCVSSEQIVGKIVFRLWPFSGFGPVS